MKPKSKSTIHLSAAASAGFTALHGIDLDPAALRVARLSVPTARLRRADALLATATADAVVTNPPFGRECRDTQQIRERWPALKGGEIERYMVCLLRALGRVRPGGVAALLVPDAWMTNARSGPLREEILRRAEADLKSTRSAMYRTAVQIWPKLFPDRPVPLDQAAAIKAVLDESAKKHPNNESIISQATRTLAETTAFVKEKRFITVFDEPLEIVPTPEFQRGVAGCREARSTRNLCNANVSCP